MFGNEKQPFNGLVRRRLIPLNGIRCFFAPILYMQLIFLYVILLYPIQFSI
jgi:hypothetical protein